MERKIHKTGHKLTRNINQNNMQITSSKFHFSGINFFVVYLVFVLE